MYILKKLFRKAVIMLCIAVMLLSAGCGERKSDEPANTTVASQTDEVSEAALTAETAAERAPLETNIIDAVPEAYREVLRKYRSAVESIVKEDITYDAESGKYFTPYEPVHELSYMLLADDATEDPAVENYGYSLKDINGDASPELFLTTDDQVLLQIYTIVDGEAQLAEHFWPRYAGIITESGELFTRGSGSAYLAHYTLSKLDAATGKFSVIKKYGHNTDLDIESGDNEKYYFKIVSGEEVTVDQAEFDSFVGAYPQPLFFYSEDNTLPYKLEFHPIAPETAE